MLANANHLLLVTRWHPGNPLSPEAIKQRRHRERCRRGAVVVQLVLGPAAVYHLVRLEWLRAADRTDREAVRDALAGFLRRALPQALREVSYIDEQGKT
jgi:hypothetical protein